jgi:two-component system nitrogen regulation sensor histidine kinase NtrY
MKLKKAKRLSYENKIFLRTLLSGLPAVVLFLLFLWRSNHSEKFCWTFSWLVLLVWFGFAYSVKEHVIAPLHTVSNLLAALREGDYSIRGKRSKRSDALDELIVEANALSKTLREQRLDAIEATALLRRVMEEVDVAVFAFDNSQRLRLVNRAGERLLGQPSERLLGRTSTELHLNGALEGPSSKVLDMAFPGSVGRWGMKRSSFRLGGLPHILLVLSDLSRALRDEERQVWQRLIRVIGHELNNSLAPIKSIAGSLETMLNKEELPDDWRLDMKRGVSVIAARADALASFMEAYSKLARLPEPKFEDVDVQSWIQHVTNLENRIPVTVQSGPPLIIQGDPNQLQQLLINVVGNAVEAAAQTGGGVEVGWKKNGHNVEIWVDDEGPGLLNPGNVFVPFFTTKSGGSGIGLLLSRQIAEAHGGSLTLENRKNGDGCHAVLRVPLTPPVNEPRP